MKRMKMGGNLKAKAFFEASPGYSPSMSIPDKYNSHFAAQYRDKLTAECEGRPWVPSAAPAAAPTRPASSNSTNSARLQPRSTAMQRTDSFSSQKSGASTQKSQNEVYFATLGSANSSRPEDLPPSQGGKYQGFGSAIPEPPPPSAPTVDELVNDPLAALSKGWSFFSSAAVSTAKSVNEKVIQPTAQRVMDPEFQEQMKGYVGTVSKQVSDIGAKGNTAFHSYMGTNPRPGGNSQYAALNQYAEHEEDFFGSYGAGGPSPAQAPPTESESEPASQPAGLSAGYGSTKTPSRTASPNTAAARRRKEKNSWDQEWQEF